jgi:glycosyltransferase involved in cell wall biosynthesis
VIPHGEYGRQARRGRSNLDPDQVRTALGAGDEEVVVLLFGQLRVDKGVRDLLEAAVAVEGVRVVLAGEDKGALREVDDLRADPRLHARLTVVEGFIAPEQAGELFAAADVVALPYHRASASGVLLLASGYERPVVAYPVGGLPEYIVEGDTGWICRTADPAELAQALRAIVAAGREVCRQRGAAAWRLAQERFSWDAIAQRTASLYREVLAETSAHKR